MHFLLWAEFLYVLGLATVCSSSVQCYYKSTGSLLKHKLMFSQLNDPRLFKLSATKKGHLLFWNNTSELSVHFTHAHYVPLITCYQKILKVKQTEMINYHYIQPAIKNLKS